MPDFALRLSLRPILLTQALTVRTGTLHFPEAKGPRGGIFGHGPFGGSHAGLTAVLRGKWQAGKV
jgi:hypothetical protein